MSDEKKPDTTIPFRETAHGKTALEALGILSGTVSQLEKVINQAPNVEMGDDVDRVAWIRALSEGVSHLFATETFHNLRDRKGSDWEQRPEFDSKPVGLARIAPGNLTGNMTGESAVLKVRSAIGLGTIINVPLWHSGLWLGLKAPMNSAILELRRRIASDRVRLGRDSNGQLFSNNEVYMIGPVIDFILQHAYTTSMGTIDPILLKRNILAADIPLLLHGMLSAMYPDGYDYVEACVADVMNCQHRTEGKISFPRMLWVDKSRLTEAQLRHMAKRRSDVTEQELETYQSAHQVIEKEVDIPDTNMTIKLRVANIQDYLINGYNWVDSIVNMVEEVFDEPPTNAERDRYILDQSRIMPLRKFAHFISEIQITESDATGVISDRDTIDATLSELSANEAVRTAILDAVHDFIEDMTMVVIGYPNLPCPSCGLRFGEKRLTGEETEEEKAKIVEANATAPKFVVMNLLTTFFTLTKQKIEISQERA